MMVWKMNFMNFQFPFGASFGAYFQGLSLAISFREVFFSNESFSRTGGLRNPGGESGELPGPGG